MLVKKELATVPVLPIPKLADKHTKTAAVSKVSLPRSGEILVVDFFSSQKLDLRFFSDGTNFITAQGWPAQEWSKHSPYTTLSGRFYASTPEDEKLVKDFLDPGYRSYRCYGILAIVDGFAAGIRKAKREKEEKKKEDLRRAHFAMFPERPANLREYCDNHVFGHGYILIDKLDKQGQRSAHCLHCGERFYVDRKARSGQETTCPKCGRKAIYKASWQSPYIRDEAKLCIAHKVDGQLLLRWVSVTRLFQSPKYVCEWDIYDYAYNLHLVENGVAKLYFYKWMKGFCQYWYDWYRGEIGDICYDRSHIYTDNLDEVFGDRYYNVNLKEALAGKRIELQFATFLNSLRDNPATEYLVKHRMPLLAEKADDLGINFECATPTFSNVMGVSAQYMDMYRSMDVSPAEHRIIKAYGKWVSPEDLQSFRALSVPDDNTNDVIGILRNMSFKRFVNYFAKQKKVAKRKIGYLLTQYRDYISMSTGLGVDLSHKSIRFPENCVEAHAQILPRFNEVKHEAEDITFQAAVAPLYAQLRVAQFEQGGFCIVLPRLRSELITEGQSLNHCVGADRYYKGHIDGTAMIFFVRRASAPGKPFFTMEVDMTSYRIKQLYGFGNCSAPKEVRQFAEAFVKKLAPAKVLRKTA